MRLDCFERRLRGWEKVIRLNWNVGEVGGDLRLGGMTYRAERVSKRAGERMILLERLETQISSPA